MGRGTWGGLECLVPVLSAGSCVPPMPILAAQMLGLPRKRLTLRAGLVTAFPWVPHAPHWGGCPLGRVGGWQRDFSVQPGVPLLWESSSQLPAGALGLVPLVSERKGRGNAWHPLEKSCSCHPVLLLPLGLQRKNRAPWPARAKGELAGLAIPMVLASPGVSDCVPLPLEMT